MKGGQVEEVRGRRGSDKKANVGKRKRFRGLMAVGGDGDGDGDDDDDGGDDDGEGDADNDGE
eukprot:8726941-Pyramimonas_sp.AAC.1